MIPRAKPSLRTKQPLKPANSIILVSGNDVSIFPPEQVTEKNVGLKAFGLVSIPIEWTKPYFVISASMPAAQDAIDEALTLAKISFNARVLVRSSGVNESIEDRGSLTSVPCAPHEIAAKIKQLAASNDVYRDGTVHWLVQELVHTEAKGHLSNERRLNKALRDWMAEVELSANSPAESHRIAIRPWRDAQPPEPAVLSCQYRANYINRLEDVARWAYQRQIRVHFEWVWDGSVVYIVQADPSDITIAGVSPESLVKIPGGKFHPAKLRVFRIAGAEEFEKYKKLGNANLYQGTGYKMPNFYILDNDDEVKKILETGVCSDDLIQDLVALTSRPLVIRTDGGTIPNGKSHMLPRSDELRSPEAAQEWLLGRFRTAIATGKLQDCNLCLIAHHFIPAVASAWCQAHPAERRVRIESLWGIPEGLYWYAHDVFDVDTRDAHIKADADRPSGLRVRERTRFKSRFIAPDINGAWIVHLAVDLHRKLTHFPQ
ncbi:hypothetical protein ACEN9F_22640 [Duganella sp. CT11-25]|uniref:hypothetical protein n=1 Tax=unclassified Duganella TaxID=2636909 RepID=UPI0039AFA6D0